MGCLRSNRLGLSGRLLAPALALAACTASEPDANEAVDDPVVNLPIVPRPEPPLDRAGLLSAVARAASASASGAADITGRGRLDGRQFEVRIRFGCRGPSLDLDQAWLGWAYDAQQRRLRVRARPTIAADDPLVAKLSGGNFEAVEGFWIPRPWLLEATCPAAAAATAPEQQQPEQQPAQQREQQAQKPTKQQSDAQPEPTAPDPLPRWPRIGIAQFFTENDARTGRRQNRPFEAVTTLAEGQPLRSQGYTLVLSGRLRALPGLGVIACSAAGFDNPPECIVSADFDRVWIETPGTDEIVAQWHSG